MTHILDGRVVGATTHSVPDVPGRGVLQTETATSTRPASHLAGSVGSDRVARAPRGGARPAVGPGPGSG